MFQAKLLATAAALLAACGTATAQYPFTPPPPPVPVFVTPPAVTGWNPHTGGLNTSGTTVLGSAFDPGRQQSMTNGTATQVNRPLYDASGRVIGQQTGVEWFNPLTGRVHGNLQNTTANGLGGVNVQNVARSANPTAGRPSGGVQPLNGVRPGTAPIRRP